MLDDAVTVDDFADSYRNDLKAGWLHADGATSQAGRALPRDLGFKGGDIMKRSPITPP